MTVRVKITVWVLVVLALLAGAAGYVLGLYYSDNKKPNFTEEYVLYVRPETTVNQIVDSLQAGAGTLRPRSIESFCKIMEVETKVKPGRYVIEPSATFI